MRSARRSSAGVPSVAAWLFLLLAPGLSGCGAPRAIPAVPFKAWREAKLSDLLAAYQGYRDGRDTWSASGDLDVRDLRAGRARKLGVRLLASRDGKLYIKGSVAVVTALEVICDAERFWFQVPSKKTVWTGHSSADPHPEADDAPYYALRPADVTQALFPPALMAGPGEAVAMEADQAGFSLALVRSDSGLVRSRVWLDRDTLALARLRLYDEHGDLKSESSFGAWQQGEPHRVSISRPREGYEASFAFDKVETHLQLPQKAFVPRTPADYKVVEVPES